jgi:hypothetical protein
MNISRTNAKAKFLFAATLLVFVFLTFCLLVLFAGEPDLLDAIRNAIYPDSEYQQ